MLHSPCGHRNPNLACMHGGNGFCRFNFPKEYISSTQLLDDGYPIYRRRSPEEGGNVYETYRKGKKVVYTNADVVPHSKYLLLKYNCHINVEFCYSIKSIKYHIKYINKGSDQANMTVETTDKTGNSNITNDENNGNEQPEIRNEVLQYQTKR